MASALDEMAYLSRSKYRLAVLDGLLDGPRERDELRASVGASSSTFGRVLTELEDRRWIRREGPRFEVTQLGAFVAEGAASLLERIETALELRSVWRWLPSELDGFRPEVVAAATVTTAEPGNPYGPANRCASFYREAATMRGIDAGLTAPHHFDELYQRIVDGMETEIILPAEVSRTIAATYPEAAAEVLSSDAFTLYLLDHVPLLRLTVFDDRVGVGGYDPESGVLVVYLDTASERTRAWAKSTYEAYRHRARRVGPDDVPS